ncbi:MAG: hypothetical protein QOK14_577, partial [Frankiaceae bacterium]|nr:hypothetical protein [Frankiaceae bacterium]
MSQSYVQGELRSARSSERWVRGRHVVVLNWRDHEHPQAGGAEVYCHAVAVQLVQAGARVTL